MITVKVTESVIIIMIIIIIIIIGDSMQQTAVLGSARILRRVLSIPA